MRLITERVDASYLEQPPPRPAQPGLVIDLLEERIFERPLRALLDPVVLAGVVVLAAMVAIRAGGALLIAAALVIAARIAVGAVRLWRQVGADVELLRSGLVVKAHILKLRPHRTTAGDIDGALLDCAIPVAPRRTYVGSVWLSNGDEALRLMRQGRVEVICLPRAPGTWRIAERIQSQISYERMGPVQSIPQDG